MVGEADRPERGVLRRRSSGAARSGSGRVGTHVRIARHHGPMIRYRPTGLSLWGAQWEHKDDDREIVRRLFNLLEDRRMLWKDFSLEIEEHCFRSADIARQQIGQLLDNPEISAGLTAKMKAIQRAFRDFMDDAGDDQQWGHRYAGTGTDRLSVALGTLRGLVGVQLGELAALYEVDVAGDLATIVPDGSGWFFERFSGGSEIPS